MELENPARGTGSSALRAGGRLAEGLRRGSFLLTVESPPLAGFRPLKEVLDDVLRLARWVEQDRRVVAITVSDRVRTDHDHDALLVGSHVVEATGAVPLVHWAGKGRTVADLERDLERARRAGLGSFLFLTGDALREAPAVRPARYLDSVDAIRLARDRSPDLLIAAAVNPFKYREEALWGQYVKAAKKLRAGADFLITQIGWDPQKLAQLRGWLTTRGLRAPVLAAVWLLTPKVASRVLAAGPLPGVSIPTDLLRCLEADAATPDRGRSRALQRAALQVVGARLLGLSGAHLCGVHRPSTLEALLDTVEAYGTTCPDLDSWQAAWQELMRHPDSRAMQLVPPSAFSADRGETDRALPSAAEVRGYRLLAAVDRLVFDGSSLVARAAGACLRAVDPQGPLGTLLVRAEAAVKGPWLGCQTCGACRLPHTFFVCPETCPKGLANGPCGGTDGNTCEFGDRECIHARIYRLAKYLGRLEVWESSWVPPVPEEVRGTCSWIHHFRGQGSRAEKLPEPGPASERTQEDVAT